MKARLQSGGELLIRAKSKLISQRTSLNICILTVFSGTGLGFRVMVGRMSDLWSRVRVEGYGWPYYVRPLEQV